MEFDATIDRKMVYRELGITQKIYPYVCLRTGFGSFEIRMNFRICFWNPDGRIQTILFQTGKATAIRRIVVRETGISFGIMGAKLRAFCACKLVRLSFVVLHIDGKYFTFMLISL